MTTQEEEDDAFIKALEEEIRIAKQNQPAQQYQIPINYGTGPNKQNLVEWQLDFKPELREIERFLRCDVKRTDPRGFDYWERNPNKNEVTFNEKGVNDILRQIRLILNKNTVLSYYRFEEVRPRIRQFGHELRALIYNNAEQYGMDNEYKQNNYTIVVISLLSMIESALRRAINGEERKGLGEARIVQQTDPVNQMPNINNYMGYGMQGQKRSKWYNPFSWGR